MRYFKFKSPQDVVFRVMPECYVNDVKLNQNKVFTGEIKNDCLYAPEFDEGCWNLDYLEEVTPLIVKDGEKGISYDSQDKSDVVNKPSHYQFGKYEPVKVIQDWDLSFCLGNVVKYVARAGRKDSGKLIEDLKKAKRYLELELENLEQE